MKKRAIILVFGIVQDVGFRYWTQRTAENMGLTGWVKNLSDGSVEIVTEGNERNLQELIDLCYTGSGSSQVRRVDVKWEEFQNEFQDFTIRW